MKLLVWLLVLLNVGLLVYFNLDVITPAPVSANRTINPEKLKILGEKELEAMPKKMVPIPVVEEVIPDQISSVTSCYKWGNFTKTNLPAAQVVLVRLGLQSEVKQEETAEEDRRFWVYYPPLKSAELAQQKADEIKALGVEDLYIVQDLQWRHAISFGLFQDEQLASNLLTNLQAKGIKGATKALRNPGKSLSSLLIKAMSAETALELHKIKPEFIGTELMPAPCT
jgi:hypothetical protein